MTRISERERVYQVMSYSKPFLPFLYETQTILHSAIQIQSKTANRLLRSSQRRAFSPCLSTQHYVPFEDGEDKSKRPTIRRMNDDQRIRTRQDMDTGSYKPSDSTSGKYKEDQGVGEVKTMPAQKRPAKDSTITVAEKKAFDQIFQNIQKRTAAEYSGAGTDSFDDESMGESLQDILSGAIANSKQGRRPPADTSDIQSAVKLYPTALQGSAAKALSVRAAAARAQRNTAADADQIEAIRRPERERVEALMRNASTDVELWKVMETEVFSMIGRLGLTSPPELSVASAKRKTQKIGRIDAELEKLRHEALGLDTPNPEQPALDINIYGPLYPAYLLLGLRLLDRSFYKSSSLVMSVLPRIKALGLASHALGGSTAIYNELIRITWQRYDDLPTIFALLQEMETAGLGFNADTRDIISEMISIQSRARGGENGQLLRNFYNMPNFDNWHMLKAWKVKCTEMIEQRAKDFEQNLQWENDVKRAEA